MRVPLWMLNESSAFLQLSAHACSIHADSKEISRGDWVKETNTKERKPESVRIDYFFFPQKDFQEESAVSQDLGMLHMPELHVSLHFQGSR